MSQHPATQPPAKPLCSVLSRSIHATPSTTHLGKSFAFSDDQLSFRFAGQAKSAHLSVIPTYLAVTIINQPCHGIMFSLSKSEAPLASSANAL